MQKPVLSQGVHPSQLVVAPIAIIDKCWTTGFITVVFAVVESVLSLK